MKKRFAAALVLMACLSACTTVPTVSGPRPIALKNASFIPDDKGRLTDWIYPVPAGTAYTYAADSAIAHSAPASLRMSRNPTKAVGTWALAEQRVNVEPAWVGKTVRLSGWLKSQGIEAGGGALVLQARALSAADMANAMLQARGGGEKILAYNHMDDTRVRGDKDWAPYSIELKIPAGAQQLQVGVLLQEEGTLWADDLKLELID